MQTVPTAATKDLLYKVNSIKERKSSTQTDEQFLIQESTACFKQTGSAVELASRVDKLFSWFTTEAIAYASKLQVLASTGSAGLTGTGMLIMEEKLYNEFKNSFIAFALQSEAVLVGKESDLFKWLFIFTLLRGSKR